MFNIVLLVISYGCIMLYFGYGFLVENVIFVDICKDYGLNFIGLNVSSYDEFFIFFIFLKCGWCCGFSFIWFYKIILVNVKIK